MSKSLGTLTLDLVAKTAGFAAGMSKAERDAEKFRKKISGDMKNIGKAAGVGFAAAAGAAALATGAIVLMAKEGLKAVDAQAKLARSMNTSYDSLTALSLAFGDSGVDGFEQSLGKLNQKLGEAERGTGEAARVIKSLGLDLQTLSNSNADDRVAMIADAIKDSGMTAQATAAALKDLGFKQAEATAMFMAGGDSVRGYSEEVKALGLSLSDIDAIKVEQANDAFARFGRLTDAASQQLAVQFAPILRAVSDLFVEMAKEYGGMGNMIASGADKSIAAIGFVADSVEGLRRVFVAVGSAIALAVQADYRMVLTLADAIINGPVWAVGELINILNALPGVDITPPSISDFGKKIKDELDITDQAIKEGIAEFQDSLLAEMPSDKIKRFVASARAAAEEAAQAAAAAGKLPKGKIQETEGSEKEKIKAVKDLAAAEREAMSDRVTMAAEIIRADKERMDNYKSLVSSLRTEDEVVNDQLRERLAILDDIGIATDENYRRAIDAATIEAPQFGGLAPEVGGAFGELNKIDAAEAELEDWYAAQLARIELFRAEKSELNALWDEEELALKQQHEDKIAQIESARQMATLAAAESTFGSMAGLAKAFAGENSKLYRAMFIAEKAASVARAIVSIQTGIAQAAANPWPINLAAMASVAAATAGIVGTIQSVNPSFEGGGFTGAGPRLGGVDGHGGFPAVLHPNETVVDNTLPQSGNQSNIRVINVLDPSIVGDYLGTDDGEEIIMNVVRRNQGGA